jgi:uncharacterized protein (DUF2235 family)
MQKNIVICCDGTNNEFKDDITNVVETYKLATKDDSQLCYYDPGVGTGGWEYDETTLDLRSKSDSATGRGLQKNVEQAYRFLMDNYQPRDKVFLFGFSRGAFTVRALAGMIQKVGILGPEHGNLLEYASKIYLTDDKKDLENRKLAREFKSTFARKCPVHFIGVWDTVQSTALTAFREFQHSRMTNETVHGYHAIAIDEKRKDFPPLLWDENAVNKPRQTCEQVWFAGVHCDVGGYYKERDLSNIALRWMLINAEGKGMKINAARLLDETVFPVNPHGKIHESLEGFWVFRGGDDRDITRLTNHRGKIKIHSSVKARVGKRSNRYNPDKLPSDSRIVYVD